jgi:hypothetical protein
VKLSRHVPVDHPLALQFRRAVESLTAAQVPNSARQYRGTARDFLIYLGDDHPAVGSLNQLRRDPHILGWFTHRSAPHWLRIAIVSLVLAREVSMHAWGLRLRSACDALAICRAPQYCLPVSLTPSAPLVLAFSELTISGYPACMCLFPTLQVRRCRRPHMGRGQDGSLLLSCMTLSFTTSRRFIPTLSRLSAWLSACATSSCRTSAGQPPESLRTA